MKNCRLIAYWLWDVNCYFKWPNNQATLCLHSQLVLFQFKSKEFFVILIENLSLVENWHRQLVLSGDCFTKKTRVVNNSYSLFTEVISWPQYAEELIKSFQFSLVTHTLLFLSVKREGERLCETPCLMRYDKWYIMSVNTGLQRFFQSRLPVDCHNIFTCATLRNLYTCSVVP